MSSKMTRHAYEQLIQGDLFWLALQPRCLEREHIAVVLQNSVALNYPDAALALPLPAADQDKPCVSCGGLDGTHTLRSCLAVLRKEHLPSAPAAESVEPQPLGTCMGAQRTPHALHPDCIGWVASEPLPVSGSPQECGETYHSLSGSRVCRKPKGHLASPTFSGHVFEPVSGSPRATTHSLERTSAMGGPFLGKCVLCGAIGLTAREANLPCPNPGGVSEDQALLNAVSGSPEPAHHEFCDALQRGPDLGPSTKPCNCKGA